MNEFLEQVRAAAASIDVSVFLRIAAYVFGGTIVAKLLSGWAGRLAGHRLDPPQAQLVRRVVYYGLLVMVAVTVLKTVGFDLSVFLGAAGILTVALGFASQTAASNLISGLFLLGERPFQLGDTVQVGDVVGELLSVEWLSVRIRTFDNRLVRIPNEALLKSNIINLTRFPIRRMNLDVPVAYGTDVERVREVLLGLFRDLPQCLDEPEPKVWFEGFGDSSLLLLAVVWARSENFIDVRSEVRGKVREALEEAGVEIPFPQRTLVPARDGTPFPVRVVEGPEGGDGGASPSSSVPDSGSG